MGNGPVDTYQPGYWFRQGGRWLQVVWYLHRDAPWLLGARASTAQYVLPEALAYGEIRVTDTGRKKAGQSCG